MKTLIAALAAVALSCPAWAANFTLQGVTYSPADYAIGGAVGHLANFDLSISDAAVQQGSFTLQSGVTFPADKKTFTGDVADFISFSVGLTSLTSADLSSTTSLPGVINFNLTFGPNGISGLLDFGGMSEDLDITIADNQFSGSFSSDETQCLNYPTPSCTASGTFALPEPASFALLLGGLLTAAFAVRLPRRAARVAGMGRAQTHRCGSDALDTAL